MSSFVCLPLWANYADVLAADGALQDCTRLQLFSSGAGGTGHTTKKKNKRIEKTLTGREGGGKVTVTSGRELGATGAITIKVDLLAGQCTCWVGEIGRQTWTQARRPVYVKPATKQSHTAQE